MGLFSSDKKLQEDIARIKDDVNGLIETVDKLTDVIAKLSMLVQEQHAAIADLYVIQTHTLKELAALATDKADYAVAPTSTIKKTTKLN